VVDNGDDSVTGSFLSTTISTDSFSMTETGTATITYSIVESDATTSTLISSGDDVTGSATSSLVESSTSSIQETGYNASGSFTLSKTATGSKTETGNEDTFTGSYTTALDDVNTSTATEATTNSEGGSIFTEGVTDSMSTQETGNRITGDYTRTFVHDDTTTDTDVGTDALGAFSVTEIGSTNDVGTRTGNYLTGDYSSSATGTDAYEMTETGSNYTLHIAGDVSTTTTETGNNLTAAYARSQTASDSYTMTETGTTTGGTFSETVLGSDTATFSESGNAANQTFTRTITIAGVYVRTESGPGATLGSNSGAISGSFGETADARSGIFAQSGSGTDRYSLLENFNDVSNTRATNSPGNMNFSPYGQPFVDPAFVVVAIAAAVIIGATCTVGFLVGWFHGPAAVGGWQAAIPFWGPARNMGAAWRVGDMNAVGVNAALLVFDIAGVALMAGGGVGGAPMFAMRGAVARVAGGAVARVAPRLGGAGVAINLQGLERLAVRIFGGNLILAQMANGAAGAGQPQPGGGGGGGGGAPRGPNNAAQRIAEHLVRDHPERFGRDLPRLQREVQNVIDNFTNSHTVQHGPTAGTQFFHRNGRSVVVRPNGEGTMIPDPNGEWFRTQVIREP
jgi:hypothetical protein